MGKIIESVIELISTIKNVESQSLKGLSQEQLLIEIENCIKEIKKVYQESQSLHQFVEEANSLILRLESEKKELSEQIDQLEDEKSVLLKQLTKA